MPDLFFKGGKPGSNEILLREENQNALERNFTPLGSKPQTPPQPDLEIPKQNNIINPIDTHKKTAKPTTMKISERLTPFKSFCSYPENFTFKDQAEDEKVILLVRRHFITNVKWLLETFLLAIIPIAVLPFISNLFPALNILNSTRLLYLSFYYLSVFGFLFVNYSIWYFNIDLITNKRIIDIDASGILLKNVSETTLDLIQDESYSQIGGIMSIFNFGNVLIQTAGEAPNFRFEAAPNPEKIIHIIGELIGKK